MNDTLDRNKPLFTPTRDDLKKYHQSPPQFSEDERQQKSFKDSEIRQEAIRRFDITLAEFGVADNSELQDPTVIDFFRQIVALKININHQRDQYCLDQSLTIVRPEDPVIQAMDYIYPYVAGEIYKQEVIDYDKKYPLDPDDEYYQDPLIHQIDIPQYVQMASDLADHCASNSYLENLFEIFASERSKDAAHIMYPNEAYRRARDYLELPNIDSRIKEIETAARLSIRSIYEDHESIVLPPLIVTSKRRWQKNCSKIGMSASSVDTFGGGYIANRTYGAITIPCDLCFIFKEKNDQLFVTSQLLFEELYHAAYSNFPKNDSHQNWPFFAHQGSASILEDGLAAYESYLFATQHLASELPPDYDQITSAQKWRRGETTDLYLANTVHTLFMTDLINRCGGDEFLSILREARTNNPEAINLARDIIDGTFGPETFASLSSISETQTEERNSLLLKMKIIKN